MKVTVSEPEAGKKQLEVEVPVERVERALQKAYGEYQKEAQLPGFRKGKVPLDMIKGRYGQTIEAKAIDALVSDTYQDVQKEHGIKPAGVAQIDEIEFEQGKPLKYTAVVEVMPEITLKAYEGIDVEKEIPRVTDADVEATMKALSEHYAEIAPVDTETEEGHFIVADIQGVDRAGVPILGDKVENADFQLGQSNLGPEFDKELVGMKRDEERRVKVVYPKDHPDQKLAGSEMFFSVTIKEIKKKIVPELNDELAKTVSGLNSLQELREEIEKDLLRRAEQKAVQMVKDQIADYLTKEHPIPIPEGMVKRYLDTLVDDIKEKSQEPFDEEIVRNRYRSYAVNQIRLHLLLGEIGRREKIEGGDEKVLDYLVSVANITEVEPIRKEDYPSLVVE